MGKCTIADLKPGQYVMADSPPDAIEPMPWARIAAIHTYLCNGAKVIEFVPRPTKHGDIGNWYYAPDELDHVVVVKS